MSGKKLKSYEFRREREGTWLELERLIDRAERSGLGALSTDNLLRLPNLYRATLSSLSVARSISLDHNLLTYLENLSARAYFVVYGARSGAAAHVLDFIRVRFPSAVRTAKWYVLASTFCVLLGVITGLVMTLGNEDWFYSFVPSDLAQGRSPAASTEELHAVLQVTDDSATDLLFVFATFLFTHNATIGMLAFALGFALGVPVVLLMFYNGLIIGAMAALYEGRGLSAEFWAWLSIHGTTELLAVVLCGGAGLLLGGSVAFPGRHSRLHNLAKNGRMAAEVVIGSVVLFFVAGLLEGFGRQLIVNTTERYLVAASAAVVWALYLLYAGRAGSNGDND